MTRTDAASPERSTRDDPPSRRHPRRSGRSSRHPRRVGRSSRHPRRAGRSPHRLRRVGRSPENGCRGQSELLGVLLLLGILVLGLVVLLLVGGSSLEESQRSADLAQAEKGFGELDARASEVALGDSHSQRVDLGLSGSDGQVRTYPDRGWLRVRFVNTSTGRTEVEVVNATLGAVVYAHGRATVAYQGGGVWRVEDGHASMVSRPEFHFRNRSLTLPVVAVGGERAPSSRVRVVRAAPAERKFPDRAAGLTNELRHTKILITVHSEYYRAWGRYFERRTGGRGIVRYDHDAGTVTVKFLSPPFARFVESGIIATAETGRLELAGNGAYTDSYDSSAGNYSQTNGSDGTVVAVGDVDTTGDSSVRGDVRSGAVVELSGETVIDGDVFWTEDYVQRGAAVSGNATQIDGVATIEPIDGTVKRKVDAARESNDNGNATVIEDDHLSIDGSTGELGAGTYYLENLSLFGETLVLNTTGGNVTVGVGDYVRIDRGGKGNPGGNLTVVGNGTVRLWVAGREDALIEGRRLPVNEDRELTFFVSRKASVDVPGERSTALRLYGTADLKSFVLGDDTDDVTVDGVVYAPAGLDGPGYVYIKQAEVFGGVVTGNLTIGQNGAIHYDEAIEDVGFPRSPVARLEYLHVAVHRVNVTSGG